MSKERSTRHTKRVHSPRFRVLALRIRLTTTIIGLSWLLQLSGPALADDGLVVVASIKPIHSIVSTIMDGVGEPHLIMKGASSPHTFNLRPSDARALDQSDVVFQVGPALEASLADIMWTLAAKADIVSLSHATKLVKLEHREGGLFSPHDHGHGLESEHVHEALAVSSRSPLAVDGGNGHEHQSEQSTESHLASLLEKTVDETFDMHIWLDPRNGQVIAEVVAAVLVKNDPENHRVYTDNLRKFVADMDELELELQKQLDALNDRPFIAFHDAYHYFEDHFNLLAVGSAVVTPGRSAGARRIQELRQRISDLNVVCVFSEPQFDEQLIVTIVEGTDAKIGVLDPLGADLEDGKSLYPTLLRNMGDSFSDCLNPLT